MIFCPFCHFGIPSHEEKLKIAKKIAKTSKELKRYKEILYLQFKKTRGKPMSCPSCFGIF